MSVSAFIFDLDGPLIDSLADIAEATNRGLVEAGWPTHTLDAYRYFVGDGMTCLVECALPKTAADAETITKVTGLTRTYLLNSWHHHTRPYPGINELLSHSSERDQKLAVLSTP